MLIAAAFAGEAAAEKIAAALRRHGMQAVAVTSGAAVLRRGEAVTLVVCGARLADMTARGLRRLLPPDRPMLLLAGGEQMIPGVERLPAGLTPARLAERIYGLIGEQAAQLARAKRALIREAGLDEAAAHQLIQRRAMDRGESLDQAAAEFLRRYGEEE
jgi:hypothetical protein